MYGEYYLSTGKQFLIELRFVYYSNFACEVAKECLSQQVLQPYMDSFAHPANGLQIALEWERLELEEIGAIEIPVVLSPVLQTALFTLSCRYGDACVAHLLSRGVRKRLAAQIAELVAAIVQEIINTADAVQRTWIQLLFDCRVLNVMFPDDRLIKLIPQIESRIDPFDLSILSKYLARNARLAVSKSLLMYSCFLVDFTHSKEDQDSQPSSQVIDVAPKSYYPPRIPLIPRLGRTAADSAARRVENAKIPRNKLLTTTNLSGKIKDEKIQLPPRHTVEDDNVGGSCGKDRSTLKFILCVFFSFHW
ncbi:hypothetical protein DICVIV_00794 [Dictyocaulus viviparus]|uniref:Conserved oligomeric Golgi complex subunit 1 n=1 Tax=Dictyocaulus viviparus TaxID=29172 RepID=A0A0D8Y870_DICVI|nr:hypothetical protein DICVIV_00794 [Dictyocaulus viviparus]